jgi:hypothetical protein
MDQILWWNKDMRWKVDGTGFKEIPSLVPSEKMKGSCFEDDNSNLWYDPRYV